MTIRFWDEDRAAAFEAALLAQPEWAEAARYFTGVIRLAAESGSLTVVVQSGTTRIDHGVTAIADVTVHGPEADWLHAAAGELDWFQATTPGFGGLSAEGDPVFIMRNVKIFWLIVQAVAQTGPVRPQPEFSPPPPARHAPTVGRYVEVDDVDIYYEEAGSGPVILCIHAASQDTLMYRHVLAGLSDAYRVIAVDAPGHGKSLPPATGALRDLGAHAYFTESFIDALGLHRPILMGCSMGGNQVLELAARRPHAYLAVVAAEAADYTPGLGGFVLDMLMVNGHQLLECYAQSLTGHRTPPDRAREVVWQIRRATPEIMQGDLGGYAGFDRRDLMDRIRAPVLLVRGTDDWLVSQDQVEATASRIARSEVAWIAGTGHYPMIENPGEFNERVRRFLADVTA